MSSINRRRDIYDYSDDESYDESDHYSQDGDGFFGDVFSKIAKKVATTGVKEVAKKAAKKAAETALDKGAESLGKKIGEKGGEKLGEIIMDKFAPTKSLPTSIPSSTNIPSLSRDDETSGEKIIKEVIKKSNNVSKSTDKPKETLNPSSNAARLAKLLL